MSDAIRTALKRKLLSAVGFSLVDGDGISLCLGVYKNPEDESSRVEFYSDFMRIYDENNNNYTISYNNIINVETNYGEKEKQCVDRVFIMENDKCNCIKVTGHKGKFRDVYLFQTFLMKIVLLSKTGNLQ